MLAGLLAGCADMPEYSKMWATPDYAMAMPQPMPQAGSSELPAPALVAAPAVTAPQGRFGVQIAAPSSEADARALIDTMRAKHPSLLGREWATIQRVALPNGVFYRVVIGPMGTAQLALQLCSNLKAQGATCFIRGT